MSDELLFALLGSVGLLIVAIASAPVGAIAILTYRRRAGAPFLLRTLGFSLLNAGVVGFGLGIAGFVIGAGVGDERAGEIAVWLVGLGLFGGGAASGVLSFLTIGLVCRRIAASVTPPAEPAGAAA